MLLTLVDRLEELRVSHPYEPVNLYVNEGGSRLMIGGEPSSAILFVYRLLHDQTTTDDGAARMRAALHGCWFKIDDDGEPLLILPSMLVAEPHE